MSTVGIVGMGGEHPMVQPALHDELVVLRAPTQVWSARDGRVGRSPVHGVTYSDVRVLSDVRLTVGGRELEHLLTTVEGADRLETHAMVRGLASPNPDPDVLVRLVRRVDGTGSTETMSVTSRLALPLSVPVSIRLVPDATFIDVIKAGGAATRPDAIAPTPAGATWSGEGVTTHLLAEDFSVRIDDDSVLLECDLELGPLGTREVTWRIEAEDEETPVNASTLARGVELPDLTGLDPRLRAWVTAAVQDLDALRMTLYGKPERQFLAAGAPWYCTLFGRDSIWAARMLLPSCLTIAEDTLYVLASMQGTRVDRETAEEPGKMIHELRRGELFAEDGTVLPPVYYGTVDATPLWVCLLFESWHAGMSDSAVIELLPNLRAALAWLRDFGDADDDGLIEYIDRSGHGLANQGWKDSHDGVQWHDGRLAQGPIALCEVQAYAYEAAMSGAELLERFGGPSGPAEAHEWRSWAVRLKDVFGEKFWIDSPHPTDGRGAYPAIALDASKAPVDSLTSNIAHLLGTGLVDAEQSRLIAAHVGSRELDSGFGLRTLSTDAAGYWPISYHAGSVWPHDTAIAITGLVADGHDDVAMRLIEGLLTASAAFGFRIPELYSGDGADAVSRPVPYPGACGPQAWSAAASFAVVAAVRAIEARSM